MITGDEIRRARQRAGWSQGELARRVGTSQRTVGNWERGDTSPSQREASVRQALQGFLDEDRPESVALSSVSDVELLGEVARRLGRAHSRQKEVAHHEHEAPMNAAGAPPAPDDADIETMRVSSIPIDEEDELARRRGEPHRRRRTGHDPEWDERYGERIAALEADPDIEAGDLPHET